jgi:thiol-disulfide isomerase/thioredoxin
MKTWLRIVGVLLVVLLTSVVLVSAQEGTEVDERYVGTVAAPPFPADIDWLNVENPLTIAGLQGKIILLDFWTYGCINCIHMIPVLEQLEERFADELVVIGVHSAKFVNEGQTDNLRQIVQRYNLHHPVINDNSFVVWQTYGARAWPTFMVIDPNGNVVASQSGEVPYEAFETYLSNMIEYYDTHPEAGTISREPLALALEGASDPGTALLFPGKVLADTAGNRLFIADSNHHRIVIADLTSYEVLATIGTGQRGFDNGAYSESTFDQPQGMTLNGNTLYIADVNNHAIRAVDLEAQTVSTIAGTGNMGRGLAPFTTVFSDPLAVDLRSPWDVEMGAGNILYIAMAGTHQLWKMNLESNTIQAAVGNGREAQLNLTLADSELAQPSGLHYHEGLLYFADSESSTVRVANLLGNSVRVIAGTTDNNLFDFADRDGAPGESRLQHALGVTGNDDGSLIYIADTYNSKIKVYDVAADTTTTIFGQSGNGAYRDGTADVAAFDEPGGIDFANGLLYVADTNNHVIRVIDLEAGTVETVQFTNPEALVINRDTVTVLGGNAADDVQVELDAQTVAAGEGELVLNLTLPSGYKINTLTDSFFNVSIEGEAVTVANERVLIADKTVTVPVTLAEGEATLTLNMTVFYCEEDALCLIDEVTVLVPVTVTADADSSTITIDRTITLPEGFASGL